MALTIENDLAAEPDESDFAGGAEEFTFTVTLSDDEADPGDTRSHELVFRIRATSPFAFADDAGGLVKELLRTVKVPNAATEFPFELTIHQQSAHNLVLLRVDLDVPDTRGTFCRITLL